MSVLRSRIINRGATDNESPAAHPYGDAETPMEMPLAHVQYGSDDTALYGTLQPLVTADGAVIPAYSTGYVHQPYPAPVAPAGRP